LAVESRRVDTTREDATRGWCAQVVGTAKAGDRVEQNDNVVTQLDQTLCTLDGELGDGGVVFGRAVEGRGNDLALDGALHVGDLFRALVDQYDHEVNLWVVLADRLGDCLKNQGLSGLRRRNDQTTLALTDWGNQVDDSGAQLGWLGLEAQAVLRVKRGEIDEFDACRCLLGGQTVD